VNRVIGYTVLGVVFCLGLAATAAAGVDWHTTEIDLGFIYRDEPQKMSFGFVNTSDDTVFVFDIEPSCDCTSAQALPSAVPPRNSGEILAFFDPMGYEGKGRVTEYIRLATSDPDTPEAELYFSIEVGIGPEPKPRALNFGSICKGESDTLNLLIHPGAQGDLKILSIESETECATIDQVGVQPSGAREFRVIACNLDCRGAMSSYINIITADPIRELIKVPITANLMGTIVIEPEVIAFGPTLPGKEVAQSVRIYCTENLGFKVEKVTCTANSVQCSLLVADENEYVLKMMIKEDAPAGRVSGQIIIETDCESQPLLTAKVTGYVRSRDQ
jgi:hypothetical protein